MISSFYYLAAYTAAAAAGFSERDSAAIARAARYTEDCAGLTAPAAGGGRESRLSQLLELAVFHYLPGNAEDILRSVNPAFYEGPGAASAPFLPLVCRPDGRLYAAAAEYACEGMASGGLSEEAALQRVGIVCHILAAAHLNRGFAGLACPAINSAGAVMEAAAPPPGQNPRELLLRARTEPLEAVYAMKPAVPDPEAGSTGCDSVKKLADCPAGIFSYESPWAMPALVSCVNPIRCAEAYFGLKAVLARVRSRAAGLEPAPPQQDEESLLNAAVFFSGIAGGNQLSRRWPSFFRWLRRLPSYKPPGEETDASYLRSFRYQALQTRERLWQENPFLLACEDILRAEKEAAPIADSLPQEGGAENSAEAGPALPAPADPRPALPGR